MGLPRESRMAEKPGTVVLGMRRVGGARDLRSEDLRFESGPAGASEAGEGGGGGRAAVVGHAEREVGGLQVGAVFFAGVGLAIGRGELEALAVNAGADEGVVERGGLGREGDARLVELLLVAEN